MNDHPHTGADAAPEAAPQDSGEPSVAALNARIAELEAEAKSARDAQLRALAEMENTRRRLERDAQTSLKFANEKLIGDLLAVCDSLELGLKAAADAGEDGKALVDGMQLTWRQMMSVLEKHGVKQLDPAGQPFNPDFHQAMTMVESTEVAPNHVLSVMQKGYTLHERLLRPAMVVVAKAPSVAPNP
ncbi:nucleotide exchange factor GrpE [Sinimarinibacterium thermocellulolyticum]|uniref:Protein GrpE n=1 Tax=Sinimarinibacterium thermocellulolyticum TaxID=3170016 RepID=A0ABV2AD72_9GAMM